jgi:hypothetical protein
MGFVTWYGNYATMQLYTKQFLYNVVLPFAIHLCFEIKTDDDAWIYDDVGTKGEGTME